MARGKGRGREWGKVVYHRQTDVKVGNFMTDLGSKRMLAECDIMTCPTLSPKVSIQIPKVILVQ